MECEGEQSYSVDKVNLCFKQSERTMVSLSRRFTGGGPGPVMNSVLNLLSLCVLSGNSQGRVEIQESSKEEPQKLVTFLKGPYREIFLGPPERHYVSIVHTIRSKTQMFQCRS